MKKTLITLLALSGIAMGGETTTFDFDSTLLGSSEASSFSTTKDEITVELQAANNANLWADAWNATSYKTDKINGLGTLSGMTDIEATGTDYISAGYNNMTITISGLTFGNTYDIAMVLGVPKLHAAAWSDLSTSNSLTSIKVGSYNETTRKTSFVSYTQGDDSIDVNCPTGFFADNVVANSNGEIIFTITSNSQRAGIAGLAIKSVPEPTTATLSLLALAGLAARRRRK